MPRLEFEESQGEGTTPPSPILRWGNSFLKVAELVLMSSLQNFRCFVFLAILLAGTAWPVPVLSWQDHNFDVSLR